MKLSELTKDVDDLKVHGKDVEISDIAYNTSNVVEGSLFFCIEGLKTSGYMFAQKAVDIGACALVLTRDIDINGEVTRIFVKDTRKAMALISSNFFNNPSKSIEMIGITGTNGKTTSTYMLKSILESQGKKTGLIGSIYNMSGDEKEEAKITTPESYDLQKILFRMKKKGVNICVMEVSSHSLELKRTYGIEYRIGIFTNLTQDHLDFHLNMDNYFSAKKKLFENCKKAVINIDDVYGQKLLKQIDCSYITFGIEKDADVKASDINVTSKGTTFKMSHRDEKVSIDLKMPGKFNVYNALGCVAASIELGISLYTVKEGLESLIKVPGRSESINTDKGFTVIIDFAHTPDGIVNILTTAREYTIGRLIVVFGCGGDRDKTKRPLMGKAAGELSDFCIITSDNPRSEEPLKIINDILPGINETKCDYVIIENRKDAIKYALANAKKDDVIVIAGKGHETYQIIKDKKIQFDEKEIVLEFLKEDI